MGVSDAHEPQPAVGAASESKRRRWYSPVGVWRSFVLRPRIAVSAAVGLLALAALAGEVPGIVRDAMAWCLAGAVYIGLAFHSMWRSPADRIRTYAARQDDSGVVILALILLAIFASFAAILGLVADAKAGTGAVRVLSLGLAAATIVISWFVMQVSFTLHYAHAYYAPHVLAQGKTAMEFPGDTNPDYWDFFYFATSIGATSQTSDVSIVAKEIRRLATMHAIVSFFFNAVVLAVTINVAAGLA